MASVVHSGYEEASSIVLDEIIIYGLADNPANITLNEDITVDSSWNRNTKVNSIHCHHYMYCLLYHRPFMYLWSWRI